MLLFRSIPLGHRSMTRHNPLLESNLRNYRHFGGAVAFLPPIAG